MGLQTSITAKEFLRHVSSERCNRFIRQNFNRAHGERMGHKRSKEKRRSVRGCGLRWWTGVCFYRPSGRALGGRVRPQTVRNVLAAFEEECLGEAQFTGDKSRLPCQTYRIFKILRKGFGVFSKFPGREKAL